MSLDTLILLQKAIAFTAIALLLSAAYSDIKTLKIPNTLVLAIGALGIVRLVLLADPIAVIFAFGFAALIFLIGFVLFSRGMIGAGDVKLLMATVTVRTRCGRGLTTATRSAGLRRHTRRSWLRSAELRIARHAVRSAPLVGHPISARRFRDDRAGGERVGALGSRSSWRIM